MNGARDGRILPRIRGIPHVRENWPCYVPHLRDYEGLLPRVIKFVRCCGGSTRFGRRMHDKVGIVAEIPECFCQKAEIAVPKELVGADGQVGIKEDFQS